MSLQNNLGGGTNAADRAAYDAAIKAEEDLAASLKAAEADDSKMIAGCEYWATAGNYTTTVNGVDKVFPYYCPSHAALEAEDRRQTRVATAEAAAKATQKQITDAAINKAIKKANAPKVDQQKQVAPVLDINPGRKFQARAVAPGIDLASFAPQALQAPASSALRGRKLKTFSEDDSAIGNVNDMYGMKRGGRVTMASRRGDGAAIRGKTRGGIR